MNHPYKNLPDRQFWSRAVSGVPPFAVDPVHAAPFRVSKNARIATAGSCFAQHIARELLNSGFNYFVTEAGPSSSSAAEREARNFGQFSARYGNIYTVRQLLQLFERAFGNPNFVVDPWRRDERWVDPFRPAAEPDGFESLHALTTDIEYHLGAVRRMFLELDIFIFTLGLTEGWVDCVSGAVLPLAPGVSGGVWDPSKFVFKNFRIAEVTADLNEFISKLRAVNPKAQIILTVSPVPLAATYENRHVLVSTIYSKSVLRTAAAEAEFSHPGVAYFPSYELITLPLLGRNYFDSDLRSVTAAGVKHVMRTFFRHMTESADPNPESRLDQQGYDSGLQEVRRVICDEEMIERAR